MAKEVFLVNVMSGVLATGDNFLQTVESFRDAKQKYILLLWRF